MIIRVKGGPGSGHHGHRGRPGLRGGSLPGGGGVASQASIDAIQKVADDLSLQPANEAKTKYYGDAEYDGQHNAKLTKLLKADGWEDLGTKKIPGRKYVHIFERGGLRLRVTPASSDSLRNVYMFTDSDDNVIADIMGLLEESAE